MNDRAHRLRQARLAAGFATAAAAADAFGWKRFTYFPNESGAAPYSFRRAKAYAEALNVRLAWLYEGDGPMSPTSGLTFIVGRVGADPSGTVLFAEGQSGDELVPLPPGASEQAVAVQVVGRSMPGLADEGALIYFEDQRTPPTPDMLGHIVVVELDTDEVLIKRLLKGSVRGRYNLESFVGDLRENVRIRWAAHVTAIIPPFQARRIIRSAA